MRGRTQGRQKTKVISKSGKKMCSVQPGSRGAEGTGGDYHWGGQFVDWTGRFRRKRTGRRVWPATGFNTVVITLGAVPEPAIPVREVRWWS